MPCRTSEYGGALENDDDVTLSNSTFTSNSSSEYGGAVYTDGATVHRITLKGNSAYYRGGLYNDNVMTLTAAPSSTTPLSMVAACTTRT